MVSVTLRPIHDRMKLTFFGDINIPQAILADRANKLKPPEREVGAFSRLFLLSRLDAVNEYSPNIALTPDIGANKVGEAERKDQHPPIN